MNAPLRRVAVACLVMFLALLANLNYVQVVKSQAYRDDGRNARVLLRAYARERGPIAIGDGRNRMALALSVATKDRLKYLRTYSAGPEYAPVTGFYSLVYGRTGIEANQERILSGEDDRLFVRRLSDLFTGRKPQGGSILLTLSAAAQQAAWSGLAGKRGAVVALDPRTGAVLAMASAPSYDPGLLSTHDPEAIRKAYTTYLADPAQPMLNRGINAAYPPGSTFKVVTTAAALAAGYHPDTRIPSPTTLALPQTSQPLTNFGGEKCGDGTTSTLADALRISCNTAFGGLGLRLGSGALRKQAQAFGFGDSSLRLPTRVSPSVFPDVLSPPQVAQSAIGQFDVRVTPLQMALIASGVANGGDIMSPYLVREVQAPDLSRLDVATPTVYRHALDRTVADQLRAMMELVVSSGTGTAAQIPGVRVAGKTGTAQHAPGQPPHAWFIGFAPADNPQVAVAVVVENGGSLGSEATGGRLAAPIARDVMRAILGR
ncbi:MAG: penicillin-binding protein 2 [Actinomycetota bacterium]|nr:penicillin-binding protein 2 [Actinomycetota bacterium]